MHREKSVFPIVAGWVVSVKRKEKREREIFQTSVVTGFAICMQQSGRAELQLGDNATRLHRPGPKALWNSTKIFITLER